jgi:uncharacterized membrane protein YjgN (DUF898 family)
MDAITSAPAEERRAIEFSGSLREFLPIAISNFLLTIVTLFIYRSWAKARERRYLWSRTRFIDDQLEWAGTGKEMFIGFIVVAVCLGIVALIFNFGLPAIAARFGPWAGIAALLVFYVVGMFLYGLARFRGLRYRLSRTTGAESAAVATTPAGLTGARPSATTWPATWSAACSIPGHRRSSGTNAGTRCPSGLSHSMRP